MTCQQDLTVCHRGGAEAAATAGAGRAADAAESNLLGNLPEKLDEFGRDENVELREEMSRRARKRSAQYSTPPAQPQVRLWGAVYSANRHTPCVSRDVIRALILVSSKRGSCKRLQRRKYDTGQTLG